MTNGRQLAGNGVPMIESKGWLMDFTGFSPSLYRLLTAFCCLITAVFLSSCSTHHTKSDGPPNYYVDETKVPNAVPKPEKLSKYGNMPYYYVFGKRYYTMKSSRHYEAVGIASWYGTKFHTHSTSSGERYNMLAMTAAHKTLPLPTYVEVTNLKNHRQIIVKVNDRGPFESNRLIDLSYVAAKKLGMLAHGTALVKVKAIDPFHFGRDYHFASHTRKQPASFAANTATGDKGQFMYLQVGAFRNRSHAVKLQQRLVAMFKAPVTVSKGKLYRVQIGPIKDVATAKKITHRLQHLGMKANKRYGV